MSLFVVKLGLLCFPDAWLIQSVCTGEADTKTALCDITTGCFHKALHAYKVKGWSFTAAWRNRCCSFLGQWWWIVFSWNPQEMQENVKKCKNFLATLIKLASHNSPSPETSKNVKALVQDLLVSFCFCFCFCFSSQEKLFQHIALYTDNMIYISLVALKKKRRSEF